MPKTSNEYGYQPTSVNRNAFTADWDTHYRSSKAPAGQTADCRSTEIGKYSTGTSMEFILLLLAGFLSLAEGQLE